MAQMVQRPIVYFVLLGLTMACALAGLASFSFLSARLDRAPQVVAVDKAELVASLEGAPWFVLPSIDEESSADAVPIVWLLTGLDCPLCRRVERRVTSLGAEIRVVAVVPRTADSARQRAVAEIARRRSGDFFAEWRARPDSPILQPIGIGPSDVGPAAVAGYAEWSHASFERLGGIATANGASLAVPALIWQRGREWRIAVRPDEDAFRVLRRDLKAAP